MLNRRTFLWGSAGLLVTGTFAVAAASVFNRKSMSDTAIDWAHDLFRFGSPEYWFKRGIIRGNAEVIFDPSHKKDAPTFSFSGRNVNIRLHPEDAEVVGKLTRIEGSLVFSGRTENNGKVTIYNNLFLLLRHVEGDITGENIAASASIMALLNSAGAGKKTIFLSNVESMDSILPMYRGDSETSFILTNAHAQRGLLAGNVICKGMKVTGARGSTPYRKGNGACPLQTG